LNFPIFDWWNSFWLNDESQMVAVAGFALKIPLLLLIIFVALVVHELGHFFVARLFKMPVKSVEIGGGKVFFDRTDRRGTRWRLRIIPFGAHVDLSTAFHARPYWQRALTIFAGPAVNLLLPFVLFTTFYVLAGQPAGQPVVVGIEKGLPGYEAGLKPGDRVLEINGVTIRNHDDLWANAYDKGVRDAVYKIRRGEKEFDLTIKPVWTSYRDDGIEREHPRFGILWTHVPFSLKSIISVNGRDTKDKPDRVRDMMARNFGKSVDIGLKGPEDETHIYTVVPLVANNPKLDDKKSREHKRIYVGPTRDNIYMRQAVLRQVYDGVHYAAVKIGKIAALPLQLFPVDPYAVGNPDNRVSNPDSKLLNFIYICTHGLAIASIFIGLLNLLPLPFLDGSHILLGGIKAATKKPLTPKLKFRIYAAAFLGVYLSALFANLDNVPRYIDSRMKSAHEFIDQGKQKERKKKENG